MCFVLLWFSTLLPLNSFLNVSHESSLTASGFDTILLLRRYLSILLSLQNVLETLEKCKLKTGKGNECFSRDLKISWIIFQVGSDRLPTGEKRSQEVSFAANREGPALGGREGLTLSVLTVGQAQC